MTMTALITVEGHFEGKDAGLLQTYQTLLQALRTFGPVTESPKQTSIHLEKNSGFEGVHPRKSLFNLEFRTDYEIENPRVVRAQQLSAKRYEHTVKLEKPTDVDAELLKWLKDAYELSK